MEPTQDTPDDLSPLEMRRARLRAFQDKVMDHVETLPMPATYIEAERAQRYIGVTDRVLVQLYSRPAKPEMRLREPSVPGDLKPSPRPKLWPENDPDLTYDFGDDGVGETTAAAEPQRTAFDTTINRSARAIAELPDLFPDASPEEMAVMLDIRREALDLITPGHSP